MKISEENKQLSGLRFSIKENDKEIARAFLYIMHNNLHTEPFAFLEDVFVSEVARGRGLGTKITKHAIKKAKELGCYKLIATSRNSRLSVHRLYKKIGFIDYGKEFRFNLL